MGRGRHIRTKTGLLATKAERLRLMGRGGDTILAHINPEEAALLKQAGGSGTKNPKTGLLEFRAQSGGGPGSGAPGAPGGRGDQSGGGRDRDRADPATQRARAAAATKAKAKPDSPATAEKKAAAAPSRNPRGNTSPAMGGVRDAATRGTRDSFAPGALGMTLGAALPEWLVKELAETSLPDKLYRQLGGTPQKAAEFLRANPFQAIKYSLDPRNVLRSVFSGDAYRAAGTPLARGLLSTVGRASALTAPLALSGSTPDPSIAELNTPPGKEGPGGLAGMINHLGAFIGLDIPQYGVKK